MNPLAIKALICVIIGLGVLLAGYKAGTLVGDAEVSALKEKAAQERSEAAVKVSEEVLKNELLKSKYQAETTRHLDHIAAVSNSVPSRVQIPAAMCADYGKADSSSGSASAVEGAGTLLKEAGRIFSAGRQRAVNLVTEAEVELAHCREVKGWVSSYTPK